MKRRAFHLASDAGKRGPGCTSGPWGGSRTHGCSPALSRGPRPHGALRGRAACTLAGHAVTFTATAKAHLPPGGHAGPPGWQSAGAAALPHGCTAPMAQLQNCLTAPHSADPPVSRACVSAARPAFEHLKTPGPRSHLVLNHISA